MKKILIALTLFVTLAVTAQAQFLNFGFRGGVGMGVHIDDLADNSPILAANIGGFVTFGFTNSQSMLGENLRLQTGLNLIRRGSMHGTYSCPSWPCSVMNSPFANRGISPSFRSVRP